MLSIQNLNTILVTYFNFIIKLIRAGLDELFFYDLNLYDFSIYLCRFSNEFSTDKKIKIICDNEHFIPYSP